MTRNAVVLVTGHIIVLATFGSLWIYLPQPGSKPRFAGTRLGPLVAAAYLGAFALATALITAGFLDYFAAH
jgi:hypothetical protein